MSADRPLRVLSCGSIPPDWGGPVSGGVATFHATIVPALDSRPDVHVVGVATHSPPIPGRVPVPVLHEPPGAGSREWLRRVVEDERPDVALLHHFTNRYGLMLPEVAPGLPLVGAAHSWHSLTDAPEADRPRRRELFERTMADLAAIVFGSDHAANEGVGLGFKYPPLQATVPYPLRPEFATPVDIVASRHGAAFAGVLTARKNPRVALEGAAAAGIAISFANVGPQLEELHRSAAEIGADAHFLGEIPVGELRRLLARSELLLMPSESESFGLLFIEALSCGTPVAGFAPTLLEIEERIGIPIGVPIEQPSPEAVTAAIVDVRAREWDRTLLRERTVAAFDPAVAAAAYASLLREAALTRRS